jgi:glycosyltransferase involved in cell wall biosynthesis
VLVSVIIPACGAQATLPRALASVFGQDWPEWEAIVVADDRFEYAGWLAGEGIADPRLRFVSTGAVRSGCHHARNVGLQAARGDLITQLDADDLFRPSRLSRLVPLAMEHGASADNIAVVLERDESLLYQPLGPIAGPQTVRMARFLKFSAPLVPVIRRDNVLPRTRGVEYAEDVIANLQLIDRLGSLPVVPEALYDYRVIDGSIAHGEKAGEAFNAAYTAYIARLEHGDGLGLSPAARPIAARGLAAKRALNAAFSAAAAVEPGLNFQIFAARNQQSSA